MANWFETVVPNNMSWLYINPEKEKVSSPGAASLADYLRGVLTDPGNPKYDNDNFTAIVNIKNGFIPINGDYSGFSIEVEGTIGGDQVDKTVLHTDNPAAEAWMWNVKKITFVEPGARMNDASKHLTLTSYSYIMRIKVEGNDTQPDANELDNARGNYWATNAEFNPKITPAALIALKRALKRPRGTENL